MNVTISASSQIGKNAGAWRSELWRQEEICSEILNRLFEGTHQVSGRKIGTGGNRVAETDAQTLARSASR